MLVVSFMQTDKQEREPKKVQKTKIDNKKGDTRDYFPPMGVSMFEQLAEQRSSLACMYSRCTCAQPRVRDGCLGYFGMLEIDVSLSEIFQIMFPKKL